MYAGDKLDRNEMERRRLAAATEVSNGARQAHLAEKYGVSRTTAYRWFHAVREGGMEAVQRRSAKGRPSHLEPDQWQRLMEVLQEGALAYGFPGHEWTTSRVAAVIEAEFNVRYQPDHVRRLRKKLLAVQPGVGRTPRIASVPGVAAAA